MRIASLTTVVVLLIAGCSSQPGSTSTVPLHPNMQIFVDSFDGTKVGAKTALTKFNLPEGDDGYQLADYNVQSTKVSKFQEDKSCYIIEFFGDTDDAGGTEYIMGRVCWDGTFENLTKIHINGIGTKTTTLKLK